MPTYSNMGEFLLVKITEPDELPLYLSVIHEVELRCGNHGLRKAVIDFSEATGEPGIMDRYTLGIEIARVWKHKIQAAGVAGVRPSIS